MAGEYYVLHDLSLRAVVCQKTGEGVANDIIMYLPQGIRLLEVKTCGGARTKTKVKQHRYKTGYYETSMCSFAAGTGTGFDQYYKTAHAIAFVKLDVLRIIYMLITEVSGSTVNFRPERFHDRCTDRSFEWIMSQL